MIAWPLILITSQDLTASLAQAYVLLEPKREVLIYRILVLVNRLQWYSDASSLLSHFNQVYLVEGSFAIVGIQQIQLLIDAIRTLSLCPF